MSNQAIQTLSTEQITQFLVAWTGGSPFTSYVRNVPPYDTFVWNGAKLIGDTGLTAAQVASLGGNLFSTVLLQTAVPVILPSSGSIANNGALTLTTALDSVRAASYMYFPAGAIQAGSLAGKYYVAMSSTTVGTIYQDTYTTGKPVIPAVPTPWVSTGPGAYTQTTATDLQGHNVVVPGLVMGINGMLRCWGIRSHANSAGGKVDRLRFAGNTTRAANLTTTNASPWQEHIINAGVFNRQRVLSDNSGELAVNLSYPANLTVDTSISQTLDVSLNISVATDWICSERLIVELFPQG